jgi:hypothetical protein
MFMHRGMNGSIVEASWAVATVLVVAGHPVVGDDRAGQGRLAGEHDGGADLGELVDLAGPE